MPRDVLQIRLYDDATPSDRERIEAGAAKAGLTVSDYVRKRLGLPRKRATAPRKPVA